MKEWISAIIDLWFVLLEPSRKIQHRWNVMLRQKHQQSLLRSMAIAVDDNQSQAQLVRRKKRKLQKMHTEASSG